MIPYSPSMIDRLIVWIKHLPGPTWLFYGLLLSVLIILSNGIIWLDGSVPFGSFDLYRTSIAFYPVSSLALIHYLNERAHRAFKAFRPALEIEEVDEAQLEYELTTLPKSKTWAVLALSLAFTIAFAFFTPELTELFQRSRVLAIVDLLIYAIVFGLIAAFVYHTLHQLRMVSVIHANAKNLNLFQSMPVYAFSGLTAQTGMGLLLLNSFSIVTDPATFVNPALNILTISTSVIAVACFLLPLQGIHERIVIEKKRLQAEVDTRLEATIQTIFQKVDTQNLNEMDQVNHLLSSLIVSRDEIAKLSTWPWNTPTITGFITVFLLPFLFRFVSTLVIQTGMNI